MRQWLTGEDLVNNLVMLRTTDKRAFVITEGDSDCQALDAHVDEASAETFPAGSKSVATVALRLIDQRALRRILVVLDRDWVGMLASPVTSSNVVYTDLYDLDVTVLECGNVFERVVAAHSHRDLRQAHLAAIGKDGRGLAVEIAAHIGLLRYLSERDRMEISCAGYPIHVVMTPLRDGVDVAKLVRVAIARSEQPAVTEPHALHTLQNSLATIQTGDAIQYCNGHDIAHTVSVLTHHWGGNAGPATIEQAMRAAFSCADLMATKLFCAVRAWAHREGTAIWSCT